MREEPQPDGVSVHTGFPNPATDTSLRSLDLNQLLIQHSASTYFFRVRGDQWQNSGVFDGDIAIVDRSLDPRKNDTVIWWDEQQDTFVISLYRAMPASATFWGVITSSIHQFRKIVGHE
jgi:SOS-response transcriptional repressor LexA